MALTVEIEAPSGATRRMRRYKVDSEDDVEATLQGYKIRTSEGETIHLSEDEVNEIRIHEE
jgi:hypothetical protein